MFLTRGIIYHEAIWRLWFSDAAGLLPVAALSAANCEPGLLEHLRHSCGTKAGESVLQQQHLYSVYVHVGANEKDFTGEWLALSARGHARPVLSAGCAACIGGTAWRWQYPFCMTYLRAGRECSSSRD